MELIIHIYTKWSDPQKKDKKNNRKFLIYIHVFLQWWSISLKASKLFKVQSSMNISWSIWFYFESKHNITQRESKIPCMFYFHPNKVFKFDQYGRFLFFVIRLLFNIVYKNKKKRSQNRLHDKGLMLILNF